MQIWLYLSFEILRDFEGGLTFFLGPTGVCFLTPSAHLRALWVMVIFHSHCRSRSHSVAVGLLAPLWMCSCHLWSGQRRCVRTWLRVKFCILQYSWWTVKWIPLRCPPSRAVDRRKKWSRLYWWYWCVWLSVAWPWRPVSSTVCSHQKKTL